MNESAIAAMGAAMPAGLFITWCTSAPHGAARVDHAVTDEAFAEHRSAPAALCGDIVAWCPMEQPPGPRCARCWSVLQGVGVVVSRQPLVEQMPPLATWLLSAIARLRIVVSCGPIGWKPPQDPPPTGHPHPTGASSQAAVAHTGDRPEPPSAAWWLQTAVGDPAGEGTRQAARPVPSPAQFASDAVTVTGAPRSSTAPSSHDAVEAASSDHPRAGTTVPPGQQGLAPRRDGHQLPAAGLSQANPEGREPDHQHVPQPRRVLVIHSKPERTIRPAPAAAPTPSPR